MKFTNIIFDFDGTLIDSRPGVVKSFKKVANELLSKEINDQEITRLIGKPLAQIISVLLEIEDKNIINKGSELFRKYYNNNGLYENMIYPGIKEMSEFLKEQSCQLFVVSNKIESFMNKILTQHDINKYFVSSIGTNGSDLKSKKAEYVKSILVNYQLEKNQTVIIGDTESDIIAGKENLIYCIGVTWGYGKEKDLVEAGADKICRSPQELKKFLDK